MTLRTWTVVRDLKVPNDCTKKKYMTHESAVLKLREIREKRERMGRKSGKRRREMYIYKCKFCRFFHLTKQPPRRREEVLNG